jgi:retron-type reverse transcriptase
MKRIGRLWERLTSFPHLLRSFVKAARGKRNTANVAQFYFNLENELLRLQDELRNGSYQPGPYRTFLICEPKERMISAAPFRDRVIHHALCGVLEPIFEKVFIPDSFASRPGKGTHAAVRRFTHFAKRHRFVLKCDVSKYFPSIDHQVLKERLGRKIKDPDVLKLAFQIIDHSNPQESVQNWFPGDNLFSPQERRRGLPLGNQTSQFFANVFLDPFDHWAKEVLRAPGYVRYVDDFLIFSDEKDWLRQAKENCRDRLEGLRLALHPTKSVISRVQDGTRFLGYRVFPTHRLLPRANVARIRRRIRAWEKAYSKGEMEWPEIVRRWAGWFGHAAQADTYGLRTRLVRAMVFQRGP